MHFFQCVKLKADAVDWFLSFRPVVRCARSMPCHWSSSWHNYGIWWGMVVLRALSLQVAFAGCPLGTRGRWGSLGWQGRQLEHPTTPARKQGSQGAGGHPQPRYQLKNTSQRTGVGFGHHVSTGQLETSSHSSRGAGSPSELVLSPVNQNSCGGMMSPGSGSKYKRYFSPRGRILQWKPETLTSPSSVQMPSKNPVLIWKLFCVVICKF